MKRILTNILLMFSVFLLPVYVSVIFIVASIFFFNNFVEAMIFGFVIDLLYGNGSIFGIHFAYFFTLIILILYLFSFSLKKILRMSL